MLGMVKVDFKLTLPDSALNKPDVCVKGRNQSLPFQLQMLHCMYMAYQVLKVIFYCGALDFTDIPRLIINLALSSYVC